MKDTVLRQRGTWVVDEETGALVEQPRADSYAEKVEREAREVTPRRSNVVQ